MNNYFLLCSFLVVLVSFDKFDLSHARVQTFSLKICFRDLIVVYEGYVRNRKTFPRICSRDEITREINSSKLIENSVLNCFYYQGKINIKNENFTGYYIYLYNHDESCLLPRAAIISNDNLYNNHKGAKKRLITENSEHLGNIHNYKSRYKTKFTRPFENSAKNLNKYYSQYNKNGYVTILPSYSRRYQNANRINQNLMDRSTSWPWKLKNYSQYYLENYRYIRGNFLKSYKETTMNPYYDILTPSMNERADYGFNTRFNNRYNNEFNYRYNNYRNRISYRNPMTRFQYTRNPLIWNRSTHRYNIRKVSLSFWNRYNRISNQSTHDYFWQKSYYARFSYFHSQDRFVWLFTGFIMFGICCISIIGVLIMKILFDKKKIEMIQKNKTSIDIGIVNSALKLDVMPPRYEDLNFNSNTIHNV